MNILKYQSTILTNVIQALNEDIGTGDITALLIPKHVASTAYLISREPAIICGRPWFNETFNQIDPHINIQWHITEGQYVKPNDHLVSLTGSVQSILTGERVALNFLQTLSGTATQCQHYSKIIQDNSTKLLDTRKTIPGLRIAQKYAVTHGGCYNHRIGLFDAFLIKENHILACNGISNAIIQAKKSYPTKPVEIEVETINEFLEARNANADIIMLDNFNHTELTKIVQMNHSLKGFKPKLEASGNITKNNLKSIADTGVDFISIGALTKHCQAIDLSMRLENLI